MSEAIARLVLASGSAARRRMLQAAGLVFEIIPPDFDEVPIKRAAAARGDRAADCAAALALGKALAVSRNMPHAWVIGADQILELEGLWFDKPADLGAARVQLMALRGRAHRLVSAVALVRDGRPVVEFLDHATLTMRQWSDAFIERYLADHGADIMRSVGCYQIEGPGIQLFERIDGDFFTIMGLPLVPLLAALRCHGLLAA